MPGDILLGEKPYFRAGSGMDVNIVAAAASLDNCDLFLTPDDHHLL